MINSQAMFSILVKLETIFQKENTFNWYGVLTVNSYFAQNCVQGEESPNTIS